MDKIRTYKMTDATGFAPNHDGEILTLATCKPGIREKAEVGKWVAGFTSKRLNNDEVGQERLVYLMKVTEKMTFDEYWEKHPQKRPEFSKLGDNIYHKNEKGKYIQEPNNNHSKRDIDQDILSKQVLISENYKYFGKDKPLDISNFKEHIKIPSTVSRYGCFSQDEKKVTEFTNFVMAQEAKSDINYSACARESSNLDPNPKKKSSSCSKK